VPRFGSIPISISISISNGASPDLGFGLVFGLSKPGIEANQAICLPALPGMVQDLAPEGRRGFGSTPMFLRIDSLFEVPFDHHYALL
jgi:hypothetical protein